MISITGQNPTIIEIAKYLKARGIYTIAISSSINTELGQVCDQIFKVSDDKFSLSREVLPIIISVQYVIETSLNVIKNPFA